MPPMIQINLLPWREQARQIQKQRFTIAVGMSVLVTFLIIMLIHFYLSSIDTRQQDANNYLQTVLGQEQMQLTELQKQKQNAILIEFRLRYLIGLKQSSFKTVKMLTELEHIIPETVSLNSLNRSGKTVILIGSAPTDLDISHFMENIKKSTDLTRPVLTEITASKEITKDRKFFKLQAIQG